MQKNTIPKILCILIALLSFTTASFAGLNDVNSTQNELKTISGRIQALKRALTATRWQQTDLQDQLKVSELKIDLINKQMEELNLDLKKATLDLEKSKITQQSYLKSLEQQRQILGEQVRILYQLGQKQSLKTILNPEDINKIDRHLTYYRYLNEAHYKTITDIKNTITILSNNMQLMNAQEQNLKTLLQQKKLQQQQEMVMQTRREAIIKKLGIQLQDKQQQLSNLANNQKSLQDTLDALLSKSPVYANTTFSQLRGKLNWPLKGKINGIYSTRDTQKLNGVIISAPEGTPVKAIYGGKVIFANWLRGFGLLVIINHGNGYMSLYARNHALYAKVGDMVSQNDVIAKIGNSGGFDKSSLYFEIRRNGSPIDPRHWCA